MRYHILEDSDRYIFLKVFITVMHSPYSRSQRKVLSYEITHHADLLSDRP